MIGRPRKPTNLKLIHGTFRKDRAQENEPEPEKVLEVPRPPSHLTKYAKKLWKSLAEELVDKGILTTVDIPALEICCEAYGQYRAAQEAVFRPVDPATGKKVKRTLAEYMKGRNSQTMPEYVAMTKSFYMLKTYLTEFGMTPASRGKLGFPATPEKEEDQMKRLYNEI